MQIYLLGSKVTNAGLAGLISKWNIQRIESEDGLKSKIEASTGKVPHFLMEVSEMNEKKYSDLKLLGSKYGKKIKFIVFYQTLTPSPVISKLHGSEILLIGPGEREITPLLIKRFFNSTDPLFRRWERYQLVTSGTVSLLSDDKVSQAVSILNFCAHGARVELTGENLKKKDFVTLDYFSHDGKKIRMQSRIVWTKPEGSVVKAGIQFISREL